MERNQIRRFVLAGRDRLHPDDRLKKSRKIRENVLSAPWINGKDTIFSYMHFRSEVQTTELIAALLAGGKRISVPLTLVEDKDLLAVNITDPADQLEPGYAGIPEPLPAWAAHSEVDPADIAIVIVPGSVFDKRGGRLGYGGGFYDRFLGRKAPQALRVGLAYEIQLVDEVPLEEHDERMDYLVTEKAVYCCGRKKDAKNSSL